MLTFTVFFQDQDMWITTDTVTSLAFMILCSVSGFVLNAINLTIYVKWRRVYSPKQTILKLLTIVDLFISTVIIPCSVVAQLFDSLPDEVRLFLSFIKLSFLFMSSLLLSIVAAQRCAAVHFPTRIQTNANTYVSVCVISVFSFIVIAPVVYQESTGKKSGLSGPECVSLTVFLGGVILMMCLYLNIFNTLRKRSSKRQASIESRRPSFISNFGSAQIISVLPYATEQRSSIIDCMRKPERHSICLPLSKKSRRLLKVVPLHPGLPSNLAIPSLTPVERLQVSSNRDFRSPLHRVPSGRRSTEDTANRKIALLMCMSTITYAVTWLPYWVAISGHSNSVILKHLFFLNQVINPVVYSLANKRFLTHVKALFTFQK